MPLHWFSPPVNIVTDKAGVSYAVTSVERAAEFLLGWRDRGEAPEWRLAIATCMAAIRGEVEVEQARAAFEAEAQAGGRLL